MRAGLGAIAPARRVRVPEVRRAGARMVRCRRAPVLAVRDLSHPEQRLLRHAVSCLPATADQVVPGELLGQAEQEQHLRPLTEAPSRRRLYTPAWRVKHKLLEAMR